MKDISLYNGKITGTWDEVKHCLTLADGSTPISTTKATGVIDKSSMLIAWAINLAKSYLIKNLVDAGTKKFDPNELAKIIEDACIQHRIVKDQAANIGKAVHDWAKRFSKGQKIAIPTDPKVKNGVLAFIDWVESSKVKFLEAESLVYSRKYKYFGWLDAIAKIGKDLVLIDYKTSKAIYPEYKFQASGYQIAWEEEHKKKIAYRIIARFDKLDGTFEHQECRDYKNDKECFLAALTLKKGLLKK